MPLYIFEKLFNNMPEKQLKGSIKSNIKLKTYNGTYITQLGTCTVTIEFKDSKKHCVFFVVLGNGQALPRMPDTAALNILNLNIDSIQVQVANCKTNREQEMHKVAEGCTNTNTVGIIKLKSNGKNQSTKLINYFYSSKNTEADKKQSNDMTQKMHNTYGNIFNGIECFKGTFSLQLKPDSKPHQVPPRHVAYALQKPFKKELKWLQELDIIAPLGIEETAQWCNSFVVVPKANGKVQLCLDPVQLNQALIRPIHRDPIINNILPKLNNVQYLSIINASSGYHNIKLDNQSSYLTMFACPFGRYRYKCLPFGAVPAGNMFQCKIDETFNDIPNIFGIADDILVKGYDKDRTDHTETVYKVLKCCQDVNLKLNKDKCHFRFMVIPFFSEVVSRDGMQPDPRKISALTEMPAP